MVQHYFFSTILVYTINILIIGTLSSYILYFFFYKNQYQNFIKNDVIYNIIRLVLTLSVGVSYIFFIFFLYFFYSYLSQFNNYSIFNNYLIVPTIFIKFSVIDLEFSIDFFGIILLFLAYFVGILSLLALDNRIF